MHSTVFFARRPVPPPMRSVAAAVPFIRRLTVFFSQTIDVYLSILFDLVSLMSFKFSGINNFVKQLSSM